MPLNVRLRLGVLLAALASASAACDLDCDDKRAKALQQSYRVAFRCNGSECRAHLTPTDAHRLWDGLPKGGIEGCRDISDRPDARSATAALGDPCCHAGGSSCKHFYYYVVSAAAAEICVVL
jgi:hypothetical protein